MPEIPEKLKKYPKTKLCEAVDTIPTKHPYMITGRHVVHASDKFMGRLGEEAIASAENAGIMCGICKGELSYKEHEYALVIAINSPKKLEELENPIKEYLLKIKKLAEEDGMAGFAFIWRKDWEKSNASRKEVGNNG